MAESQSTRSPTLDDLIALNDEIAALIRAGVPLEVGLRSFAGSVSGRLSAISQRLSDRLSSGQSLNDALDAEATGLPRAYRAVLEAGAQSGRFAEALESVAAHARTMQDVRRQISLALIYPCLIVVTAYYLFWVFIGQLLPALSATTLDPGQHPSGWLGIVQMLWSAVEWMGHIPPIVVGVFLLWWFVLSRFVSPGSGIADAGLRCVPGLRRTLFQFRLATFCELSGALVQHGVPAVKSLRLAAAAAGDSSIDKETARLSALIDRGESVADAVRDADGFPPFMKWMIRVGDRQEALAVSFQQLGEVYRRRAQSRMQWFQLLFPVLTTIFVGGGAVLIYSLSLFIPLTEMLQTLSVE